MRKRWWILVGGKGKGISCWGHSTGKGLKGNRCLEQAPQCLYTVWVIAKTTGKEQSKQAAARPCSKERDLAPGHEDILFPSDCLG